MRGAYLRGRMAHAFLRQMGGGLGIPNEDEKEEEEEDKEEDGGGGGGSALRLVARDADDYAGPSAPK